VRTEEVRKEELIRLEGKGEKEEVIGREEKKKEMIFKCKNKGIRCQEKDLVIKLIYRRER